jgi:hypothetical protein
MGYCKHNETVDSIKEGSGGGGGFSIILSTISFSTKSLLRGTSYLQVSTCGKRRVRAE